MSRTVRRKNKTNDYSWVLGGYSSVGFVYHQYQIDSNSIEGIRCIAKYHSDAQTTMETVPSAFRATINAQARARRKEVLRLLTQDIDRADEITFPKDVRSLLWLYW